MILIGVYQFFVGLRRRRAKDNFFVVGPNYTYEIDTTAWGLDPHGIGVLRVRSRASSCSPGLSWARWVGIGLLVVSAVANPFFVPYYPLWALLLIALDIFAIWAVATARLADEYISESMTTQAGMGTGSYAGDASQTGERWPAENVAGRHWAPQDVKEGAGQTAEQAQQQGQHAAQSAGQAAPPPTGQQPPPGSRPQQ